jgi:hypothetical protein
MSKAAAAFKQRKRALRAMLVCASAATIAAPAGGRSFALALGLPSKKNKPKKQKRAKKDKKRQRTTLCAHFTAPPPPKTGDESSEWSSSGDDADQAATRRQMKSAVRSSGSSMGAVMGMGTDEKRNGEGAVVPIVAARAADAVTDGMEWAFALQPRRWSQLILDPVHAKVATTLLQAVAAARDRPRRRANTPIVLVGPSGSGKTTVARMLSERVKMHVVWLHLAFEEVVSTRAYASAAAERGAMARCERVEDFTARVAVSRQRQIKSNLAGMLRREGSGPPWKTLYIMDAVETLLPSEWGQFRTQLSQPQRANQGPLVILTTSPPSQRLCAWVPRTRHLVWPAPSADMTRAVLRRAAASLRLPQARAQAVQLAVGTAAQQDMRQALLRAQFQILFSTTTTTTVAAAGDLDTRPLDLFQALSWVLHPQATPAARRRAMSNMGGMALVLVFSNMWQHAMPVDDMSRFATTLSTCAILDWRTLVGQGVCDAVLTATTSQVAAQRGARPLGRVTPATQLLRSGSGAASGAARMRLWDRETATHVSGGRKMQAADRAARLVSEHRPPPRGSVCSDHQVTTRVGDCGPALHAAWQRAGGLDQFACLRR